MFRWKLDIGDGHELVNPIYGKDVSLDKEMESGEWFYRETLNGTLTFTREDWYTIQSSPLDTDFNLILEKKDSLGTYQTFWSGIFYKTDGEFDDKNRTVKIKPKTNDRYKKLLAAKDNEYDIIKLAPKTESLTYIKRAIFQVYIYGSTFVTNIIGRNAYDVSISPPTHNDLVTWGFMNVMKLYRIIGTLAVCQYYTPHTIRNSLISQDGAYLLGVQFLRYYFRIINSTLNSNLDFKSVWSFGGINYEFWGNEGEFYYFKSLDGGNPFQEDELNPTNGTLTHVSGAINTGSQAFIYCGQLAIPTDVYDYAFRHYIQNIASGSYEFLGEFRKTYDQIKGNYFRSRDSIEENAKYVRIYSADFYTRSLTDNITLSPINDNDFSRDSGYRYVAGSPYTEFFIHDGNTINPTIYGKFSDNAFFYAGKYFDDKITTIQSIPVAKKEWEECSFWADVSIYEEGFNKSLSKAVVLKDVYRLADFIKKLLQEIDPTILHEHSPEYSNLLYGGSTEYFITPKSNIIAGNYDSADSKELIKWSDLRNNLKAIFNADYYINSENKLIIEHVSYFYNGLSLSGRRLGFDLTTLKCLETNRSWSFGANKYTYENEKIPQRFTFSFMDKTSVIFDGNPIDINNKFVSDGVNEDYTASIITTDVDFIQSAPQDVNKDGFCLLAASGGVVQIATINLGTNKIYEIQNGQLAFTNLHEKFWLDNMPASSVNINQVTKTAKTVKRTKVQEIEFPLSSDIDIDGLIKTQVGIGKIKSHKFNISTLSNKLSINHDIE